MKKLALLFALAFGQIASADSILIQSTTSTQNSGLFDEILPKFTADTGITANVVAVGTGQAIKNAKNGDGDVLFVHAKPAEEKFVAEGWGVTRYDVMYNDFVIVGPAGDPAAVKGMNDVTGALAKIAQSGAVFASRGDDSGTHKAEKRLWAAAEFDPSAASGAWYRETGSGMGATLNTGIAMGAYIMTDRATWVAFGNKADHDIVVEGDARLFNQYGVIAVNPERHPNVNADGAEQFIAWITGEKGQSAIAAYRVSGQQLFYANAK